MNLLKLIENLEKNNLKLNLNLNFSVGDIISVDIDNIDIKKKRTQNFTGLVIAKKNKGINSSFIVRKISQNVGIEKTFQTYSPLIKNLTIKSKNKIKRSKLYYLRKLFNKTNYIKNF